jgi:hypothetical protein
MKASTKLTMQSTGARHADPRTTTIYEHRRQNFDRHAAYVVVAFVAGGPRSHGLVVEPRPGGRARPLTRNR